MVSGTPTHHPLLPGLGLSRESDCARAAVVSLAFEVHTEDESEDGLPPRKRHRREVSKDIEPLMA